MTNAIILVPEITKGMKSIGSKVLLEIKKKLSVLEHQIKSIFDIDSKIHITVCTGFESDKIIEVIKKYKNIDYIFNPDYETTNQAYDIKLFIDKYPASTDILIINGGVLFSNSCIKKEMLTNKSKIFILNKTKENFSLGCSEGLNLNYIFYDLPEQWSECAYLNSESISLLKQIINKGSINQMYLFELLNELLNQNNAINKQYINKKLIMKINNVKDIEKAKVFI